MRRTRFAAFGRACATIPFPRARALGYKGVSSKTCKGIYKSLINGARCAAWGDGFFMSGEDLTIQAGLALQQDLALVSLLGVNAVLWFAC